jgi:hypothetical protein
VKRFLRTIKDRLRPLWDVEPLLTSHDLEARGEFSLRLFVALVCAAILGGCAPSVDRSDTSPASSPATPTPPAGNVFAPEPNHYFGSGGP